MVVVLFVEDVVYFCFIGIQGMGEEGLCYVFWMCSGIVVCFKDCLGECCGGWFMVLCQVFVYFQYVVVEVGIIFGYIVGDQLIFVGFQQMIVKWFVVVDGGDFVFVQCYVEQICWVDFLLYVVDWVDIVVFKQNGEEVFIWFGYVGDVDGLIFQVFEVVEW